MTSNFRAPAVHHDERDEALLEQRSSTPDTATSRVSLAVTLAGCLARNASLLAPSEATASLYPAPVACPKAGDRLPIKWNTPHQEIFPCSFRGLLSLMAWRAV